VRIPKDVEPEKLTLEQCKEMINIEIKPAKTKKTPSKATKKKTTTTKKTK
jgi:topoisomerase IA-like protein